MKETRDFNEIRKELIAIQPKLLEDLLKEKDIEELFSSSLHLIRLINEKKSNYLIAKLVSSHDREEQESINEISGELFEKIKDPIRDFKSYKETSGGVEYPVIQRLYKMCIEKCNWKDNNHRIFPLLQDLYELSKVKAKLRIDEKEQIQNFIEFPFIYFVFKEGIRKNKSFTNIISVIKREIKRLDEIADIKPTPDSLFNLYNLSNKNNDPKDAEYFLDMMDSESQKSIKKQENKEPFYQKLVSYFGRKWNER